MRPASANSRSSACTVAGRGRIGIVPEPSPGVKSSDTANAPPTPASSSTLVLGAVPTLVVLAGPTAVPPTFHWAEPSTDVYVRQNTDWPAARSMSAPVGSPSTPTPSPSGSGPTSVPQTIWPDDRGS